MAKNKSLSTLILTLTLTIASCAGPTAPARRAPSDSEQKGAAAKSDPAAGVQDAALRSILERHWEETLKHNPIRATELGDHRYDDRLADESAQAKEAMIKLRRGWLDEAAAIPADRLSASDKTTQALFVERLESDLATEACLFEEWTISANRNPLSLTNNLPELHPVASAEDGKNLVARYRALPASIDQQIANLSRGVKKGVFQNAESVGRVLKMIDTQLKQPVPKWPVFELVGKKTSGARLSPAETESLKTELAASINEGVRPALLRWAEFVRKEIMPNARGEDRSGLSALPFGTACYAALIRRHTTLPLTAAALHQTGLDEIARINQEMRTLGNKLFGTDDLAKILIRLRTDKALYFSTDQEVEETAERALSAARSKIKDYFGILPKAECVVARVPDYEAPFTTIAYYRAPVPDGSKPGQYFINVYQPSTRPRYEAEALAFHESIPGHHLQIAIAQELPELPAFRKYGGATAFVEGWGLYTEGLANEMGLYSGDLDRMGMLSYEAWRASRLVVDTGIHALGWSRGRAKTFMLEHTALAANNIDNEVDRYIVGAGQALAYKTGQLRILQLKKTAQKELGKDFDIKAFHDAVLGRGAVSLGVLEAQVRAWIEHRTATAERR